MICRNYDNIDEKVYTGTLANGLKICVVPKSGFKTFYAVFAVNYGGADASFTLNGERYETPAGVAHFLEHKMFDLPGGEDALTIMSSNGANPNAFTSSDMTAYHFQCTTDFETNLKTLLHFVTTPYFTEASVRKEQGIIGQEIAMGEDNPGITLYYNLLKILYRCHPVREKVIGSVDSIAQITPETLYLCHKSFYTPGNMVLCVEGDVDPERIYAIAAESVTEAAACVPKPDYGAEESVFPVTNRISDSAEIFAPQFYIGAKVAPENGGHYPLRKRIISQLALRTMLGTSSAFYTRLYTEGLLNRDYDFETDYSCGTATVLIGGESKEPERVFAELLKEADSVRLSGLDPMAFERAKKASFGSRLRALEDFESVCLSLVTGVFEGYDALDALSELDSVTVDECNAFIAETLTNERMAMSVIMPKRSAE